MKTTKHTLSLSGSMKTIPLKEEDRTKFNLLNAFENELTQAYIEDKGTDDTKHTDVVIDKYMDMDTDLFDSDDLNEIIDRVAEKILG